MDGSNSNLNDQLWIDHQSTREGIHPSYTWTDTPTCDVTSGSNGPLSWCDSRSVWMWMCVSAVLLAYMIPEGLLRSLANTSVRMSLSSALRV